MTVEKIVTVYTGRDVATSEPAVDAERWLSRLGRFAELLDGHLTAWVHLWERLSIEFDDFSDELRILRLHLLHLLQTVSPNTADLDVGVPARGLHGEAYRGHIFWDELFIFPVLNLRLPDDHPVAARLPLPAAAGGTPRRREPPATPARCSRGSPAATDARKANGCTSIRAAATGIPDASARAHHIGIAVAYNAWKFYQVTGDLAYLIDYGAELLAEIARFWVSMATYDEERDRYGIRGVIGPDEFHSGYPDAPYDGIDNNAYTNVMAVWVIMRAIDALESAAAAEPPGPAWRRSDCTVTNSRTGMTSADGCSSRSTTASSASSRATAIWRSWTGTATADSTATSSAWTASWRPSSDDVNRYKASKQADALMLLYLLSADELRELLDRLGYRFTPEQVPNMVDYYLARTSHGSTLSGVVHTWVLARANRDRAMEFFQQALKSDVADIQGGTTSEGIHLAAMAGTVDLMQRCFTGLETRSNRIILSPHWPEALACWRYRSTTVVCTCTCGSAGRA